MNNIDYMTQRTILTNEQHAIEAELTRDKAEHKQKMAKMSEEKQALRRAYLELKAQIKNEKIAFELRATERAPRIIELQGKLSVLRAERQATAVTEEDTKRSIVLHLDQQFEVLLPALQKTEEGRHLAELVLARREARKLPIQAAAE